MYFLLNASPSLFDVDISDFPGPWVTCCGGYSATFCVTMTPRSKVKKRIFAMVYHRRQSSYNLNTFLSMAV